MDGAHVKETKIIAQTSSRRSSFNKGDNLLGKRIKQSNLMPKLLRRPANSQSSVRAREQPSAMEVSEVSSPGLLNRSIRSKRINKAKGTSITPIKDNRKTA